MFFNFSGKSPFGFADESHLLDDGSLDQTVPNMNSPSRGSPSSQSGLERMEHYSRKVFVGGLPPDIDEGNLFVRVQIGLIRFAYHVHVWSNATILLYKR